MPPAGDVSWRRARAVVVAYALVDDADFPKVSAHFWTLWKSPQGNVRYAVRRAGKKFVYMQHLVLQPKAGCDVSHVNSNGLDNQRHNLRYTSRTENLLNPNDGARKHNTTGIRNVQRHGRGWRARVQVFGELLCSTVFDTVEEAAAAAVELRAKALAKVRSFK